jgi:hypothetical protein
VNLFCEPFVIAQFARRLIKLPMQTLPCFTPRTAPPEESVEFKTYRFPPILQRGRCVSCGRPAIEYLKIFPMPRIVLVPSANIDDKELVPEPSIHIFNDTRVADIQDELPKYNGYLKSQFAIGHRVMASLLRRSIHS